MKGPRIRFSVTILTAIFLVVFVMTAITTTMVLTVSQRAADQTSAQVFSTAARFAREQTGAIVQTALDLAVTGSAVPSLRQAPDAFPVNHPATPYLISAVQSSPVLYSVYVGHGDGSFLQAILARDRPGVIAEHGAPGDTEIILRTIVPAGENSVSAPVQYWTYLAADGTVIGRDVDSPEGYDPRRRPWYLGAINADEGSGFVTDPYRFDSLQAMGFTASQALPEGVGVLGVDITLQTLQRFVDSDVIAPRGGLAILDRNGEAVAARATIEPLVGMIRETEPAGTAAGAAVDSAATAADARRATLSDGQEWLYSTSALDIGVTTPWRVVAGAPVDEFLGPFRGLRQRIIALAIILLITLFPVLFLYARALSRMIDALVEDTRHIRDLEFLSRPPLSSWVEEFHQLGLGFHDMKTSLALRTRQLDANMQQLAKIIELNIAISAESDINRLSELILQGARELSHADAGSLYLKNGEGTVLDFQIVLNETLGFAQGGTSGSPVTLPSVPLYGDDGEPNNHNVVTHTFHTGETFNIADAYNAEQFDFSGTRRFDEANNYRSTSMLTVPLKPRGSGIIGAMQLINCTDPETGEIQPFSAEMQRFVEALSAGAATALYNRDLIETQKRLFDSMIQLIAGAIDAKSPYTGGHCARVPILAEMLGREAEQMTTGPLADFSFESDQDRRAFRIGAWLHDAGKVTTPDYVVDKSTKLETIYNRIHEIRTRFEVILRDARIARHEAVLAGADPAEEDRKLKEIEERLTEDYAFVAECNLGGEFMSEDRLERLREISRRSWMRHFDDTLGLSWEEANRVSREAVKALPVEEQLLADKPEHVIPRTGKFAETYDGRGFTIPVPEALYNRGELYNLSIGRGTLSPEERFKINEHVMQTIVMLEGMPFPDELQRVPEYAGTHHEALNGSGYPRQLTDADLSTPARIMAIADIFEALTASDRPYKHAKPLSVCVDILSKFRDEGHIDADLFALFLTSGAYRRYAEEYLKPEQIDEVDISKYL